MCETYCRDKLYCKATLTHQCTSCVSHLNSSVNASQTQSVKGDITHPGKFLGNDSSKDTVMSQSHRIARSTVAGGLDLYV
ncbi:uncharacterized [Tachysurus ichikawai]